MLYTRKGDDGTTNSFGCDQRFSKSSIVAEALGSLDEVNSFLGWCGVKANKDFNILVEEKNLSSADIIDRIQQDLFIIQAEIAGAEKTIENKKVLWLEEVIAQIEKELPPINNFIIAGGTEFSCLLDFARTMSRQTERRVVAVSEEGLVKINRETLAYLNRLSSLLYALARFVNLKSGVVEKNPHY